MLLTNFLCYEQFYITNHSLCKNFLNSDSLDNNLKNCREFKNKNFKLIRHKILTFDDFPLKVRNRERVYSKKLNVNEFEWKKEMRPKILVTALNYESEKVHFSAAARL